MDYEQQIVALNAETLALQTLLVQILGRLAVQNAGMAHAIKLGFDDASSVTEDSAVKFGKSASPEHIVKAIRIIEELRTATLGYPDKPKHAI
jgi:hypothetical protein